MAPLHAVLGLMNKLGKAKPSKSLGFSGTHELGRGGGGTRTIIRSAHSLIRYT